MGSHPAICKLKCELKHEIKYLKKDILFFAYIFMWKRRVFLYAEKIVFGMAIISLVAIIVLCQKAGVRLKETFRESEETNSGAVIGMKRKGE